MHALSQNSRILPVISVVHMACAAIPPAGLPHVCEMDRDEGNTNQFVSSSLSGEMAMLQVQKNDTFHQEVPWKCRKCTSEWEGGRGRSLQGATEDKWGQNLTGDEGYTGHLPARPRCLHTSLGMRCGSGSHKPDT